MPDLTLIPAIGAAILVIISVVAATSLPKSVALHWNLAGLPDAYGSKWVLVAIAILPNILWLALEALLQGTSGATASQTLPALRMALPLLMAAIALGIGYAILANLGVKPPIWILLSLIVVLALGFVAIILNIALGSGLAE